MRFFFPSITTGDLKSSSPERQYYDPDLFDPESGRIDTFRPFRGTLEKAGLEDTVVPLVCRSEIAARAWATPLSLGLH